MKRRNLERGGAMIELVLLAPWSLFLFAGALDCGYYAYALISVESAVRLLVTRAFTFTLRQPALPG